MFLHIGGSEIVFSTELIGIFHLDLENSAVNKDFLNTESNSPASIIPGSTRHKSFVVTSKNVYISPISPLTLSRRRNVTL